jgi:hypothetical protein
MNNPAITVKVKRSIELISQLIDLADAAILLVLEGDLSQFNDNGLTGIERTSRENAAYPLGRPNNRVAIPLTPDNVPVVKLNVLPRVGIRAQICHVFLEGNGRILFNAYDHFKNGAQFHDWISDEALNKLAYEGIIELEEDLTLRSGFRRNHEPFYHLNQPHGGYSYRKY